MIKNFIFDFFCGSELQFLIYNVPSKRWQLLGKFSDPVEKIQVNDRRIEMDKDT